MMMILCVIPKIACFICCVCLLGAGEGGAGRQQAAESSGG